MTEKELRGIPPFDKLPFFAEDESDGLLHPDEPSKFEGTISEASDMEELNTLRKDSNQVPAGAIRYEGGVVRAIFWLKRK